MSGVRVNVREDYAAFLRAKVMPGVRYDGDFAILPTWDHASRDISESLSEHAPHLHEYQRFAVTFAVARQRAALFLECGLGKTSIALAWAENVRRGMPAIICAPLAALHEFENEQAKFYPSAPLRLVATADVDAWLDAPEGIALMTHHAFTRDRDLSGVGAFVLDECFPADTVIDCVDSAGRLQRKYIEAVQVGDRIINAYGVDTVADVHRREVSHAVRITVAGKQVVTSSPNHPYFTQRGWVGASDLRPGDYVCKTAAGMRLVQDGVCPEGPVSFARSEVLREILLSEMADAPAGEYRAGALAGSGGEAWAQPVGMAPVRQAWCAEGIGTHTKIEPDVRPRGSEENIPPIERDRPRSFRAWGERAWIDGAAADLEGCDLRQMDSGICFVTGSTDSGLSNALQDRLGRSRQETRDRGGWALPPEPASLGREERCEAGFARVDGVEILEPGHPDLERYRSADGKLYFYDIGATRHPSFSVEGMLVHNSSILKSGAGAIAQALTRSTRPVAHRLALSATPAPNDPTEYAQHAVFLGYMRSDAEFRARFFVRDGKEWRVKGHAKEALPKWLSRFALWMRDPSAYGMPCSALPHGEPVLTEVDLAPVDHGMELDHDLFGAAAVPLTMSQRSTIRNNLYNEDARTARVVDLCRGEPTIVWAMRNQHADDLEKAIRAAGLRVQQIAGTTPDESRVDAVRAFQAGELDVLVSKPKVIGHGVNLQRADRMIFAGYDESYESLHQAVRRAHRQGRTGELAVYLMVAPEERSVVTALRAKGDRWRGDSERQEREFTRALAHDLEAYNKGLTMTIEVDTTTRIPAEQSEHYWLQHGDSIELMADMPENSVDLSVFSPPFSSLFTYSSESADMGNCSDQATVEFNLHFAHFAERLLRVMKPGRVVCLHLAQLIAFRARHGRKGLRDFRGDVVRVMEDAGFHFYGEFVVPKNPQAVAIRTKSERLQFSQFKRDSLESSPALNDYVLEFRKPGKQDVPVLNDVSNEEWIRWASGVWGDIRETDVLSYQSARGQEDEKHICPLQLTVIERCVRLWTNPGEVVFTPFMGIGSEVYTAIRQRRIGWGVELKSEYFRQALKNAEIAVSETYHQTDLMVGAA